MSKLTTDASVSGTELSGAALKSELAGLHAALHTAGLQEGSRTTIIADATLTVAQCGLVLVDCTGGNVALTLPTSGSTTDDAIYLVRRIDSTSNTLTLTRGGSDTVEGAATAVSVAAQGVLGLQMPAGGTDWKVYNRSGGTAAGARTAIGLVIGTDVVAAGAIGSSGLTMATSRLLGRTTASTGAVEELNANQARAHLLQLPPVRQTVLSGPVDSSGYSAFGGSTGSTTVTASGTLVLASANGTSGDRYGSITDPEWTSITANSYATLTINSDGTCTPNVRTLAPVYQWGGTPSVTNGQLTFNIQEMKMYLGNGTTADQVHEVVVGEFAASGTVSAITWYALMGRTELLSAVLATSQIQVLNHLIGTTPKKRYSKLVCTTNDGNHVVGDEVDDWFMGSDGGTVRFAGVTVNATVVSQNMGASALGILNKTSAGTVTNITMGSWKMKHLVERGW